MPIGAKFVRCALAGALAASLSVSASAQGGPGPGPTPAPAAGDRITAAAVLRELRALGLQGELSPDSSGSPRVITTVDTFKWGILFYGCATSGELENRPCQSLQFFSIYTMANPVSSVTMNAWNSDNRFARGSSYTSSDGKPTARIAVDAWFGNTGADPARMFRTYYNIMKLQSVEFRKHIGFN